MTSIGAAHPSDLAVVRDLLVAAGLPLDGFGAVAADVVVARDETSAVVGTASLEHYGDDGLIRSVAVAADHRGEGIGSALAEAIEKRAADSGFSAVYLLTDTAETFFARRGYRVVARESAPDAVRASIEWSQACGVSAIPMMRTIG
jgi:amino-acid N-acetyltransferase